VENKTCKNCGGQMRFDRKVPDGDPNGSTVDQFECTDCGALDVED
jgi:hypothetical protein